MDEQPSTPAAGHGPKKWRWLVHLLVLTLFPLSIGFLGLFSAETEEGPILPTGVEGLVTTALAELALFGVVFALAWLASRASASQLFLHGGEGVRHAWRGLLYSLLLRGVLILATVLITAAAYALSGGSTAALERLRPEVENVVDATALRDPLYLALTLTLISFVVAGLREELWRAGMLAGMAALCPWLFDNWRGRMLAVALVAVVFGIGHLTQGLGGVLFTTALGIGLGWIMLRHHSIWDAVFAHGFFNATTFAMLYAVMRFRPEALG